MSDLVFLIEFGAVFGGVMLFCLWQLRSLDKLDREEERAHADLDGSRHSQNASKSL